MTDLIAARVGHDVGVADALSREHAEELDRSDPLAGFRDRFVRPEEDLRYLDGNSLGRLPRATVDRLATVVTEEWGRGLIRSWSSWIGLCRSVGDAIAASVVGARPGEVVVSDSTTVNLYKLAAAALDARPGRSVVLGSADEFPTDRYVLEGLCSARGLSLRSVPTDIDEGLSVSAVREALDSSVALVCLSQVAYRSGALADLAAITEAAHSVGALVLWDLSHSGGSVPVDLARAGADLAVGCTYKYLNGGPGAPAYLYVRADLQDSLRQPIQGWFGTGTSSGWGRRTSRCAGIDRFLVGTPPILAVAAVEEGVRLTAEAGIDRLRAKGVAMTSYLVDAGRRVAGPAGLPAGLAARPGPARLARLAAPPGGLAGLPGDDRPRRGAGLPDAGPAAARAGAADHPVRRRARRAGAGP